MTNPTENDKDQARGEAVEKVERDAWLDLFAAAPPHVVEALSLSHDTMHGVGLLASSVVPITELNRAMALGAETPSFERNVDLAVTWLDENAADGWALQIRPHAIDARSQAVLESAGLEPAGNGWAKFMLPAAGFNEGRKLSACSIIRADAETAETYGRVSQGGFAMPGIFAEWFAHLVGRPGWTCFLGIMDGTPVGAAAMFACGAEAWLGIDAVLPPYRTRGIHADLIAARVSQAAGQQVKTLTCETARPRNDDEGGYSSYRNYKRAGFELCYTRPNFKRRTVSPRSPA